MPVRAFVSSTYLDLKEHRAYVIDRLTRGGIDVDPMERWTAASDEPKELSTARVDGCDLCILLVGFRRGHVAEGETLSITQMEFMEAARREIDVLVFMAHEEAKWPPGAVDELSRDPEMQRWRAELKEHRTVAFFTPQPESIDVDAALIRWFDGRRALKGRAAAEEEGFPIQVRAASNSEGVLIAWRTEKPIDGCLGFAIQRKTLGDAGVVEDTLSTFLGFSTAGEKASSAVQPIQRFRWIDRPSLDREVRYRVVPMIGTAEALHESERGSGWTPWIARSTNQTPGYRAFFNRAVGVRPKRMTPQPAEDEVRSTLLALLRAASARGQRVYAALPEIKDREIKRELAALGRQLHSVHPSRSATSFLVICDRWGTPMQVWTSSAPGPGEGSAMFIDSVPLARSYLDRWEDMRDGRRRPRPAQIAIGATSMTVWHAPRGDADVADVARLVRGARQGVLYLLSGLRKSKLLSEEILRLEGGDLFVQGVVRTKGGLLLMEPDRRLIARGATIGSTIVLVDPFGPHPVIVSGTDGDGLVIIENAPELAAEYAVHITAIYDSLRFRAFITMVSPGASFTLHGSDAWQQPYFRDRRRTELNFLFGTLAPGATGL